MRLCGCAGPDTHKKCNKKNFNRQPENLYLGYILVNEANVAEMWWKKPTKVTFALKLKKW